MIVGVIVNSTVSIVVSVIDSRLVSVIVNICVKTVIVKTISPRRLKKIAGKKTSPINIIGYEIAAKKSL